MRSSELARIERLAALFGGQAGSSVVVGIGDDAAVLEPPSAGALVWTVDSQVEGVHFRREWMTMSDVGWRSFVAAASDLLAMGATPWCALSALTCPREMNDEELDLLTAGQAEAARALGCPVVGGNLSRGGELSVTTTVLGTTVRPVRRSGALPGDSVWIAGAVGLAAAGLRALEQSRLPHGDLDAAVAAFRRPTVYLEAGRELGRLAHAAIDVSDGLTRDVGHLAEASGVAVVLDAAALLAHAGDSLVRAAAAVRHDPLDLLLAGGEDYALVAASIDPVPGFSYVGSVVEGAGLRLLHDGEPRPLALRGFDHFAAPR